MRTIEFRDGQEIPPRPNGGVTGGWQNPEPLGSDLLPVRAFDFELLPVALHDCVADIADLMQAPPDLRAACAVVPNLWGSIVAPAGFMKSPVLAAVTRPLHSVETKWRFEHDAELEEFERYKEEQALRHRAWEQIAVRHFKKKARSRRFGLMRPGPSLWRAAWYSMIRRTKSCTKFCATTPPACSSSAMS